MEASMQVSLSDSDVMRVAQAVADLLAPKLGARADLPAVMTLKDVMHHTGMGRTKVLGQIEAGCFPKPFERGGRGCTMLWRGSDVQKWIETRRS